MINEKTVAAPDFKRPRIKDHNDLNVQLDRMFLRQGWRKIGAGAFGRVYDNPHYEGWVMKTFHDPAYFTYLEKTRRSHNPHFPVVGKRYEIGRDLEEGFPTYACMVERLSKVRPLGIPLMKYLRYMFPQAHVGRKPPRSQDAANGIKPRPGEKAAIIQEIETLYPHMRDAVNILTNLAENHYYEFDLMVRNIMWRQNVPVFTDPVFPK